MIPHKTERKRSERGTLWWWSWQQGVEEAWIADVFGEFYSMVCPRRGKGDEFLHGWTNGHVAGLKVIRWSGMVRPCKRLECGHWNVFHLFLTFHAVLFFSL